MTTEEILENTRLRVEREQKLHDLFGEEISGETGAPSHISIALLGRMLESLEKHDAMQERMAKAFESIAENLGHVRVAINLENRRRKAPRRRRKAAAK